MSVTQYGLAGMSDDLVEWPIPPDISVHECAKWEDVPAKWSPFRAQSSFKLPLSSGKLFLLSRGLTAGSVKVQTVDEESDVVTVTVIAHYRHEDGLDWVRVCAINRGENENGVGFFVSDNIPPVLSTFPSHVHLNSGSQFHSRSSTSYSSA